MVIFKHCVGEINTENLSVHEFDAVKASEQKYDVMINSSVLIELKKPEYRETLVKNNIAIVKKAISASVNKEQFIIQSINAIEELDRICNGLSKRLREWYGYYFPESVEKIVDNEIFVRTILGKDKKELMSDFNLKESMGPDIGENNIEDADIEKIIEYARQIQSMYDQRESLKNYLEELMKEICPNVYAVAGTIIGAKLMEKAGSLRHLSMMPSSTIQLLGAERALFRHLRNKKIRPPKHGIILNHPYVLDSKNRGKSARMLSAKISIAAKVDYFKGEYIGDKLKL
jgi:nucleolar protein 56